MSWDIDLTIDTGADEPTSVWESNMTYNVSPMYYDAIEIDGGFRGLSGLSSADAVPILKKAIEKMENDPEKYKAMEPSNKWGTYDQALKFLQDLLLNCKKHSLTKILIQ